MSSSAEEGLDRRTFVRRATIAGAAGIWVPPVVEAFVLTPAHAATPSTGTGGKGGGSGTAGESAHKPSGGGSGTDAFSAHDPSGGAAAGTSGSGTEGLAATGPDVPVAGGVIAGTAAVVLGAAAVAAGRKRAPKPTAAE